MRKKANHKSGAGDAQVFELTMDNPEDQNELNSRLRKSGPMTEKKLSRRTVLTVGGALVAGGVLGVVGWEGWRSLASHTGPPAKPSGEDAEAAKKPAVPAVIDVHVHLVNPGLPGMPLVAAPDGTPLDGAAQAMANAIQTAMKQAAVEHALCMPRREPAEDDPLGIKGTRAVAALVPGLHPVGLADPERFDADHLARVEEALKRRDVVALKAYLGYLHHAPEDPGYRAYYKLAAKYGIPVIFHTGDTYSQSAKVKYAHPRLIDDVAVDFPETNFVIAHMGNPWLMDAAEVIYKNNWKNARRNVWADLSALLVGSADDFEKYRKEGVLTAVIEHVRKAMQFAEWYDRLLFGSDWPLAPLEVYRDFIRELVPEEHHQEVFYDNAMSLFKLA
jgi:predicted TIM-barrel fold metal-dependent hydrolase